jgi:uncharacterized membrane protein
LLAMFDAESRRTIRRFAVIAIVVVVFSAIQDPEVRVRAATAAFSICSIVAAGFALFAREKLGARNLNRWDEALAFMGVKHFIAIAL